MQKRQCKDREKGALGTVMDIVGFDLGSNATHVHFQHKN